MKKNQKNEPQINSENESDSFDKSVDKKEPVIGDHANKETNLDSTKVKKSKSSPSVKKTAIQNNTSSVTSIFLLLILISIGFSAYDYWLLQSQAPINSQLLETQEIFEARIGQLEQVLQKTKSDLADEVQTHKGTQAELQSVNAALQAISEKLGRTSVAWRMAEVEYLLTVANHRLTLAQDRETAIAVFATADNRLKAIGDPSLLGVRKILAGELTALRAVPDVDIPGIAVQIGSLADSVDQLPLVDKKRLALVTEKSLSQPPTEWRDVPAAVWKDIKSLVQVRRHQQPTEPLLPPKEAWFLYQNLQLKLEQARLAVLQHNTAVYVKSLDEVAKWLDGYFDTESTVVISMLETVKKLSEVELQPALPDVSGSLRELRSVMNARSPIKTPVADKTVSEEVTVQ